MFFQILGTAIHSIIKVCSLSMSDFCRSWLPLTGTRAVSLSLPGPFAHGVLKSISTVEVVESQTIHLKNSMWAHRLKKSEKMTVMKIIRERITWVPICKSWTTVLGVPFCATNETAVSKLDRTNTGRKSMCTGYDKNIDQGWIPSCRIFMIEVCGAASG